MEPITIALISSVGTLLVAFGASTIVNAVRGAEQNRDWPEDIPRVDWRTFLGTWVTRLGQSLRSETVAEELPETVPAKRSMSLLMARTINRLNPVFQLLGVALALWLVLEWPLRWFWSAQWGRPLVLPEWTQLWLPLVTAAAVGYWTNFIAIKMLFHPKRDWVIWHGLVPAKRDEIIEAISEGIVARLISPAIVREYLHETGILRDLLKEITAALRSMVADEEFRRDFKGLLYTWLSDLTYDPDVRTKTETFVREGIERWTTHSAFSALVVQLLKSSMSDRQIAEKLLESLPGAVDGLYENLETRLSRAPETIENHATDIENWISQAIYEAVHHIDVRGVVTRQLSRMDEDEIEQMLTGTVDSELTFIQTSGGAFGALVGAAVAAPVFRLGLLATIGILTLAIWIRLRRA